MITTDSSVFILHLVSTSIMVGVIWIIQLVHYPTFLFIDKQKYMKFQEFHMSRVSYIVMPTMIAELFSGIYILFYNNVLMVNTFFLLASFSLFLNWVITALVFVKIHNGLLIKYEKNIILLLVKLNWLRTILWSLRLVFLTIIIFIFDIIQ